MFEFAVIGGGVIGAVTARELCRYTPSVCILEKEEDVAMGATKANSAIIHAGYDAKEGTLKAKFNVEGAKLMPKLAAELGVSYQVNGSLVVGYNDKDLETIHELYKRGVKNGVEGLQILNAEQVRQLEPNIADIVTCALYAPTSAIITPYELAISAAGNAIDNGAELKLNFEVVKIDKTSRGYKIYSANGEVVEARAVVNAAGLFADEIARMAGDETIKIHPRRGEYILLDKEYGNVVKSTIFQTPTKMGKGILVSPTTDGNLILGPTSVDIEDKLDTSTTEEGYKKILGEVGRMVKNISTRATITSFCGLRSVGNTGDFYINIIHGNFVNLAAIESPGLSSSPAIAKHVVELFKSAGKKMKLRSDFIEKRLSMHFFRNLSEEEKNEYIKENPKYGKIICRCEKVSEGEIIDAIRINPGARTFDGVKRRTRSGMGRCQGGFCMPYVCAILSRELGIPFEEVTKSGGGSKICTAKTKDGAKV